MPAVEAKRDWKVGVRAEAYYDNNVSRSSKAVAVTRSLSEDDYVFVPGVTLSFVQPLGRNAAFIDASGGYTFHRYNSELDRQRAKVSGGFAAVLGPCRQVTFGGYDAAQSDLATLDARTSSNLRKTQTIGAGLECQRSQGPGGSIVVQRADSKNSADTVKESDTTTEAATLSIAYSQATLGTISVGASYSQSEFPNRIIPGRPVGDGFFTQSYFLGYRREFGSRLTLSGQGGLSHLKREFAPPGVEQSINTSSYGLDVLYGLGQRIDIEVHASRQLMPSQQVGKTHDKRTSVSGDVSYRAGTRITVTTGVAWQDIESNVDTASALLAVSSAEVRSVYGTLAFRPNELMSFQLNIRYEDRDANLPQFTYTATRVGLSAQTNF